MMPGAPNYGCDMPDGPARVEADAGRHGGATRMEYHPMDFRPISVADEAESDWNGWVRTTKPRGAGDPMDLTTGSTGPGAGDASLT